MKQVKHSLKCELKALAKTITESKMQFKQDQRDGVELWKSEAYKTLCKSQYEFRHKHIVRCLLNGRTMLEIENVDRNLPEYAGTKPDQTYIDQLMKGFQDEANSRSAGDLSKSQQAVQVGHAIREWCWNSPSQWKHWEKTLVLLKAQNLAHLQSVSHSFSDRADMVTWHEPDLDNEMTSFAVLGVALDLPLV